MQWVSYLETTLGSIAIRANAEGLTDVAFITTQTQPACPNQHTQQGKQQLTEYFASQRTQFTVALAAFGTPFQQRVWQTLVAIPYGETRSYGEQAVAIGQPTASRAVGMANSKNPIAIIVPCHRVIGKSGKLTGYASGLDKKSWLLDHEQQYLQRAST